RHVWRSRGKQRGRLRSKQGDDVNRRQRRKMSWATVVRDQNFTAHVKHEQLPKRRFSGETDHTVRTDFICKPVIWNRFIRSTCKSDKQLWIPVEQPPREFAIRQRRPPPQRQQIACVRVEQDEWRRTDTGIFALQQHVDFRNFGRCWPKSWHWLICRWRKVEGWKQRWIAGQCFNHHFEHLARVEMRIVQKPVRH